jgi:ABC-type glutathione transport system ATPase component
MFGTSPIETRMGGAVSHHDYVRMREQTKGKIYVIDSRFNDSIAGHSDQWLPINPGTDAALIAALAHELIVNKQIDLDFVHKYAVGFDEEEAVNMLDKYPDELSGGEKHRVALAQVLIKEPKIIILDEPTGTMDPITRVMVTDSILKAREDLDQTFLIISHDMDFVLDVCDRSSLMRGGKILKTGKPQDIVKELTVDEKEGMFN